MPPTTRKKLSKVLKLPKDFWPVIKPTDAIDEKTKSELKDIIIELQGDLIAQDRQLIAIQKGHEMFMNKAYETLAKTK